MCTLILCSRVFSDTPLLVAANRDERFDRPSDAPARFEHQGMPVYAPRDRLAGGTWLGVNAHGLFVGITNRNDGRAPDPTRRSRGQLVLDALSAADPDEAARRALEHGVEAHNGFHLFVADRSAAHLIYNDGTSVTHRALDPGVHVLTERSLGAQDTNREDYARRKLEAFETPPTNDALIELLHTRSSEDAPFDRPTVRVESFNYGTRASTIIRLPASAEDASSFLHADGPPPTPFVDSSDGLGEVLRER